MPKSPRRPFHELTPPEQAGILCATTSFQLFAGERVIRKGLQLTDQATAEFVRTFCDITSRRELTTNQTAAAKFQTLRTEYDAWRGAIPPQR